MKQADEAGWGHSSRRAASQLAARGPLTRPRPRRQASTSELFGRVLRVNLAKADAMKLGGNRPVWEASADDFFRRDEDADGNGEDGAQAG